MQQHLEAEVLVAGAGPVGLTLAMTLASRGVKVLVVEPRARLEPPSVKCNHVSARSMEIFRRLGVAAAVRQAGLPPDYPHDIAYRVSATGKELTRIHIPCRRERYTDTEGPDGNWPTAEPPHRINQIFLEPILFRAAEACAGVTLLNEHRLAGFRQDANGVEASIEGLDGEPRLTVACRYLVGCDGARSGVRHAIGARLQGDAVVQRVQSTYIRAPGLRERFAHAPAWATFSLNPVRCGNMYAIDGKERWLIHNYLRDDEPDFDSVDRDACIRAILGVGPEFAYETISHEDWYGRRLVATHLRDRRAFICGDAAHLWVPYAGYGMNAGIADAENLGWLLAARLQGWGGPGVLDGYEAERLPITEQVSHFAMNHAHAMAQQRGSVPPNIDDDDAAGAAARAELGARAYALNVQQYACAGLNFGYFYAESALIAYDGEAAPAYTMGSFEPSTVPGCRTPYFVLADGRPLYDAMGTGYTVLRFDSGIDLAPLLAAARAVGMPLQVLDADRQDPRAAVYRHRLLISRPDQHVAWRGDALPADVQGLVDRLRGAWAAA
ncbi:monooxygenase [Verticiella sediminum]|uniref:Monooxygenase n=1 Tax=Verticiella sediminum TaxID=1247510 RepID=A0A556AU47_9BURK|nr:FAD-dependent oxidoreductase [Verticiella sediminum]TSH96436.1 monooxygenase [Verticiella sediminum]